MMNFLGDQIEATVGMPGLVPRFPERRPPILAQQLGGTVNNIQLNSSVVGAINTGTVEHLQASLSQINAGSQPDLAQGLAKLVEAVAGNTELSVDQKNEIAEQVDFRAEQAALPPEGRRLSAVKAVLAAVKDSALTVSAVGTVSAPRHGRAGSSCFAPHR